MITVRTKSSSNVKEVVRFFNRNFPEAVLKVPCLLLRLTDKLEMSLSNSDSSPIVNVKSSSTNDNEKYYFMHSILAHLEGNRLSNPPALSWLLTTTSAVIRITSCRFDAIEEKDDDLAF